MTGPSMTMTKTKTKTKKKLLIPSAYTEGYEKACGKAPHGKAQSKINNYDQASIDNYIQHTTMGDPELDPIMEELSSLPSVILHRFVKAGIEQEDEVLSMAPQALRDFFKTLEEPPPWLDYKKFDPGIRAFHANADLVLVAFVTGVLVEGFSILIAKSFNMTGRVLSTTRRLQQNNRHIMDIFFPNGLHTGNDGWKLSIRIRFIHSRIRTLLAKSDDWNNEAWGTPISAAHLGFAISVFSKRLLDYSLQVGAKFSTEEKESVLAIWRYSGYLMGIPKTILYTNAADAEKIYKISCICEPPPDADSVLVANGLIQATPSIVDVTDPAEQKKLTKLVYRISRALIGNKLANQLEFPKSYVFKVLFLFRMKQRIQRLWKGEQKVRLSNFSQLLQISVYDAYGLNYRMPDHVKHSKSKPW